MKVYPVSLPLFFKILNVAMNNPSWLTIIESQKPHRSWDSRNSPHLSLDFAYTSHPFSSIKVPTLHNFLFFSAPSLLTHNMFVCFLLYVGNPGIGRALLSTFLSFPSSSNHSGWRQDHDVPLLLSLPQKSLLLWQEDGIYKNHLFSMARVCGRWFLWYRHIYSFPFYGVAEHTVEKRDI